MHTLYSQKCVKSKNCRCCRKVLQQKNQWKVIIPNQKNVSFGSHTDNLCSDSWFIRSCKNASTIFKFFGIFHRNTVKFLFSGHIYSSLKPKCMNNTSSGTHHAGIIKLLTICCNRSMFSTIQRLCSNIIW